MPEGHPYTISEIASIAGVTARTVRYYVAQGLLPAPDETGRGPHYDDRHLLRLRLVRELQKRHLPLAEIRRRLAAMTDAQVSTAVVEMTEPAEDVENTDRSSALDYVRSILAPSHRAAETPASLSAMEPGRTDRRGVPSALFIRTGSRMPSIGREEPLPPSMTPTETVPVPATTSERSQWDRIVLTPDIEIHVRRPLGRLDNKRVDRLITIARQVLKEETP